MEKIKGHWWAVIDMEVNAIDSVHLYESDANERAETYGDIKTKVERVKVEIFRIKT